MIGIPLNDNGFDKKKSKVEDTSNFIHLNILHHDAQCDILLLENRFAELTKILLVTPKYTISFSTCSTIHNVVYFKYFMKCFKLKIKKYR